MEWGEYIQEVLSEETYLDGIYISHNNERYEIPRIIKASVYLLEKMIKNQGRCNLFVFPDGEITPFVFMLSKLIYNIGIGKIESDYNVDSFYAGQKLKFGSSIAEFIKVEYEPSFKEEAIFLKFSDCTFICKKQFAPYFQTIDTKRPLSKSSKFIHEQRRIEEEEKEHNSTINALYNMKTHMTESLIYISSLTKSIEYIKSIGLDGKEICDYFFVAQTDYSGKLETIKGLYSGIPALILSSNIAYANETVRKGAHVQSTIINLIDNDIETQLAELDELISLKIPVLCITSTSHSFNLDELKRRKFNIWRWNEDSITENMCIGNSYIVHKNKCCKYQNILYREMHCVSISDSFGILYGFRKIIEDESALLNTLYNKLFEISSSFLRRIIWFETNEKEKILLDLSECNQMLEKERCFIDDTIYNGINRAIRLLKDVVVENAIEQKIQVIEDDIIRTRSNVICIVCPNSDDARRINNEWNKVFNKHGIHKTLVVMNVRGFLKNPPDCDCDIFLTGWFGSKAIRMILFGFNSSRIHVYLYECENRWRKAHVRSWQKTLTNDDNKVAVQKSFKRKKDGSTIILKSSKEVDTSSENDSEIVNEQDDIDLAIQENKYRQYISNGYRNGGVEVEACPISFAGGDFALYTKGHKSLVVTKIIHQLSSKIEIKETENIQVGDFIVIRTSSKDIIREVADRILNASGKADIRNRVEIWKETLRVESNFSSDNEIYEKLQSYGCTRSFMTIKNWIYSDDIIIPQSKDDLLCIAKATEDAVLLKKMDTIFEEGTFIKRAHIKAGNILSSRLTESIAEILIKDKFDPYNVWDPIELDIDEVGRVYIFKVIDISSK